MWTQKKYANVSLILIYQAITCCITTAVFTLLLSYQFMINKGFHSKHNMQSQWATLYTFLTQLSRRRLFTCIIHLFTRWIFDDEQLKKFSENFDYDVCNNKKSEL